MPKHLSGTRLSEKKGIFMKIPSKVIIITLLPVVSFLVWFGIVASLTLLAKPVATTGDKIELSENPNRAMLIIDLFNYNTRRNAGVLNVLVDQKRADLVIEQNNEAIDLLRKSMTSILFIYMAFEKWTPKSLFITTIPIKGTYKAQIDSRLHKEKNDPEFNKPAGDAFSSTKIQEYLNNNRIGTLFISGGATEYCVYMTVWGARNRGYKVYVIDEATYSLNPAKKSEYFKKYIDLGAEIISIKDIPSKLDEIEIENTVSK